MVVILFFLAAAVTVALYRWLRGKKRAAFDFSSLLALPQEGISIRALLQEKKELLLYLAFFCLFFALLGPDIKIKSNQPPSYAISGRALYLLIDHSSSMTELCGEKSKLEIVIELAADFAKKRPGDFLGVVALARDAPMICPLTLANRYVATVLSSITPVTSIDQDGSAIGYAIFKTLNSIAATTFFASKEHPIHTGAILLFTDGLESPNPLDRNDPYRFLRVSEALQMAKSQNIRVYYITLVPEYAEQELLQHIDEVKREVEETHGAFFIATSKDALQAVMKQVDTVEKASIPIPEVGVEAISLRPYLLWIALFFLIFYIAIETIFARVRP